MPPSDKDGGFFLLQDGVDVWNFGGRVALCKGSNKKLFRYPPTFKLQTRSDVAAQPRAGPFPFFLFFNVPSARNHP
ncbi:hypothetical protein BMI91_13770 [Thioclava sediminum]|uniref:Uncharacterized protein n=1 Tax=Thioclava sediminum TaxID=1915319 RepID=A0ABX3MV27_9RHOB|nr:hypothetical protein BMI91_13770 [Thioclava sediminum]